MEKLKDLKESEGVLLYLCRGGVLKHTRNPSSTPGGQFFPLCVYFITLDRHFLFSACLANAIPSGVTLSGRITPKDPMECGWWGQTSEGDRVQHKQEPLVITTS